jgi:hypothetical protein
MTWLGRVRELTPKHISAHFFSLASYFRCVTTVTYSPQSTCIEGKTSSTLDVFVPLCGASSPCTSEYLGLEPNMLERSAISCGMCNLELPASIQN